MYGLGWRFLVVGQVSSTRWTNTQSKSGNTHPLGPPSLTVLSLLRPDQYLHMPFLFVQQAMVALAHQVIETDAV